MHDLNIRTKVIHNKKPPGNNWGASVHPIFQTASFEYETADEIIAGKSLFGGTLSLLNQYYRKFDVSTLVIHPAGTIYRQVSKEDALNAGVTDDLLRISVGIEDINDIIADFDQALKEVIV